MARVLWKTCESLNRRGRAVVRKRCLAVGAIAQVLAPVLSVHAEPIQLGPLTAHFVIYGVAVDPKVAGYAAAATTSSTVKVQGRLTATFDRLQLAAALKAFAEGELKEIRTSVCTFAVKNLVKADVIVDKGSAIISLELSLIPKCLIGPDNIRVRLWVAPEVRKGGILGANVGIVKVELPSLWAVGNTAVEQNVKSSLQQLLRSRTFSMPRERYGRSALQSVEIAQRTNEITVRVSADGLFSRDEINALIGDALSTQLMAFPSK